MKRLLIATTAIVIASWAAPRSANALFGVGDICANCATEWTQIASWAKEAADMAREYSQFVQANSSLTGIVGSLSGAAGVDTSGLTSIRSVLSDAGQIQGAISGTMNMGRGISAGGVGGFSLSGAANAILNQNTVYRPAGGDFMAQWINARAQGQAAQQAYMQEFVRSGQSRLQALQDLKAKQMAATTTDERMAIQNEIGRTQEELSTQAMQAQQIAALSDMQDRVSQQQIIEKQRADSDALQQATRAAADATGLDRNWTGSASAPAGGTLASAAQPASVTSSALTGSPKFVPTFNVGSN
jgi:hypothetical protein